MKAGLSVGAAVLLSACAAAPSESQLQHLAGARNEALRAAGERYGVSDELLAAVGYEQSRFEQEMGSVTSSAASGPWAPTEPVLPEEAKGIDPARFQDAVGGAEHVRAERYGPMQLSPEQIARGAELIGRDEAAIRNHAEANIHAAAALLRAGAEAPPAGVAPLSDEAFTLAALELMGARSSPEAAAYLRRDLADLRQSGFDLTTRDGERISLRGEGGLWSRQQAVVAPGAYPPFDFIAAASGGYKGGRSGETPRFIIIHDMEGYMAGTIDVFTSNKGTSAHYAVAANGRVVQFVSEANTAYQCGHGFYNSASIGIEHEGFEDFPDGKGYYSKQYALSAQLTCAIAKKYNIPVDRQHIIGHGNVPHAQNTQVLCTDTQAYINKSGNCGGINGHLDPGKEWLWDKFMAMVAQCVTEANGGGQPPDAGTPPPEMDAGTVMPPPVCPELSAGPDCKPANCTVDADCGAGQACTNRVCVPSTAGQQQGSPIKPLPDATGCTGAAGAPLLPLALGVLARLAARRSRSRR